MLKKLFLTMTVVLFASSSAMAASSSVLNGPDGKPLSNAHCRIVSPDGKTTAMSSDKEGKLSAAPVKGAKVQCVQAGKGFTTVHQGESQVKVIAMKSGACYLYEATPKGHQLCQMDNACHLVRHGGATICENK